MAKESVRVEERARNVELLERTNLPFCVQDVHSSVANSSEVEPVSKTTLTGCGGVPTGKVRAGGGQTVG